MTFSKKELKKLRDKLPAGSYQKIAVLTGLTESSVRAVLFYPDRYNERVISEAINIVELSKQTIVAQKTAIKKL